MTAQETLDIIAKPWCNLENLMKLAQVGRNLALECFIIVVLEKENLEDYNGKILI